jgi:CubicO group peptidase (beta-lactamase class C family)
MPRVQGRNLYSRAFCVIAITFLLFSCNEATQTSAGEFETRVVEYLNTHIAQKTFNGSVLIAKNGQILYSNGFGMANIELGVPNTPKTKFRLGSITKQFTAMLIMQLQERGILSVKDPLSKYISDYPDGEKITIHHLLTHTSGVPSFTDFPDYTKIMVQPLVPEEIIALFKKKPLEFEPGTKYKYSNSGYVLLGYILEKITDKPYDLLLKENIFDPLGMGRSGYDWNRDILENRASGYSIDKGELVNDSYIDMHIPHAAGALYSTVEDLYIWDRALYTDKLLSRESLDKMFTPFLNNYAYGWSVSELSGRKLISHSGGINGFVTYIARFPEEDACIIVLCNLTASRTGQIFRDLAAILFGEQYELPKEKKVAQVDPALFDAYTGTYELEDGRSIRVYKEGDRIFAEFEGQGTAELFPESETRFFIKEADIGISFVRNETGSVHRLIIHQGGKEVPAKKMK